MEKKYTYFISSTFVDLEKERQAVINYIMEMEEIPIGMESFGAIDRPPWEHIKKLIDTADYYILIIAGKYGSIYTEDGQGLSYTHMEYRYAVSKGIPVIAIIHEEPGKLIRDLVETDPERVDKLEAFKAEVKDGRLATRFRTVTDIIARIGVAVPKAKQLMPRPGWIRNVDMVDGRVLEQISRQHEDEKQRLRASYEEDIAALRRRIDESDDHPDYAAVFEEGLKTEESIDRSFLLSTFMETPVKFDFKYDNGLFATDKSVEITRGSIFAIIADEIVSGHFNVKENRAATYLSMTNAAYLDAIPRRERRDVALKPLYSAFDLAIELFEKAGLIETVDEKPLLTEIGENIRRQNSFP